MSVMSAASAGGFVVVVTAETTWEACDTPIMQQIQAVQFSSVLLLRHVRLFVTP